MRGHQASQILSLEKYDDDSVCWGEGMVFLHCLEFAQNYFSVSTLYFLMGYSLSSAVCPQAYVHHDSFSLYNMISFKGEIHAIGQNNAKLKLKHIWE